MVLRMSETIYHIFIRQNYIQFSFQLLICELPFLIGMQKKKNFRLRVVIVAVLYLVAVKAWCGLISPFAANGSFMPFVFVYLGYAVLTGVLIKALFESGWMEVIFIVASGYASEHMCFAMSRIVLYLLGIPYSTYGNLLHAFITRYVIFAVMAVIEYLIIVRGNRRKEFSKGDFRIAALAAVLLITAITLSVYWSYDSALENTKVGGIICPAYTFICSALILVIAYRILWENEMKQEHERMEEMLRMADAQQKSSQEAIDIINIKCHDLKHQIRALEHVEDDVERAGYLKEIAGAISIYDATYNTGSRALDYVLREKALLFNEYGIEFSCMADGRSISFLAPADIYALFGNALDNALECVQEEKEGERFISFHLTRRGAMVLIHLENRCSRKVEFADGMPVTHKADKIQHGFGVRSIVYITEKYHGQTFMKAENGKYLLDIMIPYQEVQSGSADKEKGLHN